MHSLHRFLVDYEMAMLRALSQTRGVELTSNRQPEAVDQMAAALLEPLSVRVAVAHLSGGAREALEALLAAGGRMRVPQFERRYGPLRRIGPGRLEREQPWQNPANPVEELQYLGLIFRAFEQDDAGAGEFVFVPDDLVPVLPAAPARAPLFAVETAPAPARPRDGGPALVQDLFTFLVYLHTHDVRPFADGRLGRRDLAALRRRLTDAGERRLAFVRHLAARLGFVVRQEEWLRLEAAPVKRWLAASTGTQVAALQEAWRDDETWNDLRHVPGLAFDPEAEWHLRNDPAATRRAILALLAQCPAGEWWTAAAFAAAVKRVHPDFQRPDGDYTAWYIRDAASGAYLSGFEAWDGVEGALLADLLAGPLAWLGVVATGGEGEALYCVTGAGAGLLGREAPMAEEAPAEAESPAPPPIVVGPDMSILVPAPANLYTRFQVERFADLESEAPCRYRLTVDSVGRAVGRGLRIDQVLAFLQQASEQHVPAGVAGLLRLWAGRYNSARLEEVALLRVESERVLKELSILPETKALIGRVLSPTTALVAKKDLPQLRKELHTLGYLRAEVGEEEEARAPGL